MNKHSFTRINTIKSKATASFKETRIIGFLLMSLFTLQAVTSYSQTTIGGVNMGNLTNYLFFFADGSTDANWQGATKGFAGDVAVDGLQAKERTSGGVPFSGTIYTNDNNLSAWASIVDQNDPGQVNPAQAFGVTSQASRISNLEADLNTAFTQINARPASPGFSSVSSTSLNGLNKQNGVAETFVINITSGLQVSSKINITGDAGDVFILRWDSDGNPNNGYQGQTKFQSGGAVVPLGGLKPSNFINVAGDINSSGGGSAPAAPYPQGPRFNNGTGNLVTNAANFSGGGYFTGYWLTTGNPTNGESSSMSNGIFVGGWYTTAKKFSLTSGTSGVHVAPNLPPPPTNSCLGEAANYVLLGLQGGNVSINSGTNLIGDIGYSAGVTSSTNQKLGDDGQFNGTVYVHGSVNQFSFASQNFLPSGGIVQNNAAQNTRLNQANASAVTASASFAALPPNVIFGALNDNDSKTINRTGSVTVVSIASLNYKEDQLTLVGQPGQNDAFVINVLGNFEFSGSKIVLQNVSPNMVVFNFPNASTIYLNKASNIFNGTILAPTGSVEYHNPAVFNGGIVAKNITLHSDFNITKKPLEIPCSACLDNDADGVCNDQDCKPNDPAFPAAPGSPCNDGNPNTVNDVVQFDGCSCAGNTVVDCTVTGGVCTGCDALMSVTFPTGNGCVNITSCKALSNVVVRTQNGAEVKFDNLTANSQSFCSPDGSPIIRVWVKSGCFESGDGPGYGRRFDKPASCVPVIICDNVTLGGTIGFGTDCSSAFQYCPATGPAPIIGNCISPTGGTGNFEIIWLKSTSSCTFPTTTAAEIMAGLDPHWSIIPGATGLTLDPGNVTQQTCYLRCSRRTGCSTFIESNIISLGIAPNCGGGNTPDCNNIIITTGIGVVNVSGIAGSPVTSVQISNANLQEVVNCLGTCASPTASFPLPAGTYNVKVKYHTAAYVLICEKNQTVNVVSALEGSQAEGLDFGAAKADELTTLFWNHDNGYLVEKYIVERSTDGIEFREISEQVSKGGQSKEVYEDFDLEPATGDNFYRLRIVNADGSFSYSVVQKVNFSDVVDYTIFPNPASSFAKLNLETMVGIQDVTITIFNNLGFQVKQIELDEVWSKHYQMDIRDLQEGHYTVWLNVPGNRPIAKKLMVGKL